MDWMVFNVLRPESLSQTLFEFGVNIWSLAREADVSEL